MAVCTSDFGKRPEIEGPYLKNKKKQANLKKNLIKN